MRPGATGMRISGTRRPRSSKNASSSPRRSYSRCGSQRSSCTTSSTRFDVRVEATPNRSRRLISAEAAHFHVVPRQLRAAADDDRRRAAPDLDGVVGDQPMSADDEVERALALADAALPHHEHAKAEDVEQHAVDHFADGEAILEQRGQLADRRGRADRVVSSGTPARSASVTRSGGASRPPVISTHGTSVANDCRKRLATRPRRRGPRDSAPRSRRKSARGPAAGTRGSRPARDRSSGCRDW